MEKIKWIICDDSKYVRFAYMEGLEHHKDIQNVGECENAEECIELCKKIKPDIVLLDIQLENGIIGTDIISEIIEVSENTKVIMLSSYKIDKYVLEAFGNGAVGYVLKEHPMENVYKSIVDVYNNNSVIPNEIAQILAKTAVEVRTEHRSLLYAVEMISSLSVSELEVLKGRYMNKSYQQIADERFVSLSAVKVLGSRVLKKFSAPDMNTLVKELRELQVFELFK